MLLDEVELSRIDRGRGLRQRRVKSERPGQEEQCVHVARQTRPAVWSASPQQTGTNSRIEGQHARDRVEIRSAETIPELGKQICKRYLQAEKCVVCDLRKLDVPDREGTDRRRRGDYSMIEGRGT